MAHPQVQTQNGVAILSFGEGTQSLEESTLAAIQEQVLEASNVDPPYLVVDLSGVDFFGSSFIEVLFRLWSRLNGRQGKFAICGLSTYCREVIDVTNLGTLWAICETREEAIAQVKSE